MKIKCPVCGYLTVEGNWDICPVCFWEMGDITDENEKSFANHELTLAQARENYCLFGACCERLIKSCRPPYADEMPEGKAYGAAEKAAMDKYLNPFFRSILEQDRSPVVVCNLMHDIIYMNVSSKEHYKRFNVREGDSLLDCHNPRSREMIEKVVEWFSKSPDNNLIYTYRNDKENKDVYMVALRNEENELIGYYEKHEYRNAETMNLYDFR